MRLSDLMGNMDLAVWPKMALIIFLLAFAAVLVRVLTSKRSHTDHMSAMPLADDRDLKATSARNTNSNDKGATRGA